MVFILEVVACVLIVLCDRKLSLSLFNMLYWLFFCVVGNLYFADYQDTHLGTNYILFCCILLYCGSNFGRKIKLFGNNKRNMCLAEEAGKSKGEKIIATAIVLEIVLCLYAFFSGGFSLSSINRFLVDSGNAYFRESANMVWLSNIMNLGYAYIVSAFSLDGYLIANRLIGSTYKSKIGKLLFGMALYAIMNGRKSLLIWPILFWVMGILVATCEKKTRTSKEKVSVVQFVWRFVKRYIVIIIVFVVVMLLMFITRSMALGNKGDALPGFMKYLFGHIPVFNTWFKNITTESLNYSMGQQTIFGVLDQIGIASSDLYPNYALLGYGNADTLSNIYSVYRGYIEDFGIIGTLTLSFVFGIVLGSAEKKAKSSAKNGVSLAIISIAATFIMFSFIISPWHYFTVFVSNVFFICELICLKNRNSEQQTVSDGR